MDVVHLEQLHRPGSVLLKQRVVRISGRKHLDFVTF
jgi:hypothetical protein